MHSLSRKNEWAANTSGSLSHPAAEITCQSRYSSENLEADELVTARVEPQAGRPDKRSYTITAAGREALKEWLAEPLQALPPSRNAGLLKLFFSGRLDRDLVLRQLQAQLDLHLERLQHYEDDTKRMIEEIVRDTGLAREGAMWELVRELGERHERAYVEWLESALEKVRRLE